MVSDVLQEGALGRFYFIVYTDNMIWIDFENRLAAYADHGTLLTVVVIYVVSPSLNRALVRISVWRNLWSMEIIYNKTQA